MADTLRFPVDTRNDTKYEGTITFQPETPQAFDLQSVLGAGVRANDLQNATEQQVDEAEQENFFSKLFGFNGGGRPNANTNQFTGKSNERTKGSGQKCILYLPQSVQIADGATYDNINLGRIGEGIRRGVSEGNDIIETVAGSSIDAFKSAISAMRVGAALSGPAGQAAIAAASSAPGCLPPCLRR